MIAVVVITIRLLWLTVKWWAADVNAQDTRVYEACVRPGSTR